jgi:UDP-2,3-diacylglucosamine hydrolase
VNGGPPAAQPPAALPVWMPPSGWQAIDFISDLHLAADHPRTVRAWAGYLAGTRADVVVMLGDVFEAWVGDDSRGLPFESGLVQAIVASARTRTLAFMAGNRDFLVGPEMLAACGVTGLADPCILQAAGRAWVLAHGDAQCLSDQRYQAFRAQVRSKAWQRAFLARPLAERLEQARAMRRESMRLQQGGTESAGDLDPEACRDLLRQAGAETLIHGHTHRPALHDLGGGWSRQVLSDWDLDDGAAPRAEVLRLTPDGRLQRLSPAAACAA